MGFAYSTHLTRRHFERSVLMTKDAAMHSSTRAVRVGGADIHVTEWGAGPPVLLLHGNPDSGIMWEGIAERLAPHYRCGAAERPGFGHSEVPANFERSLDGLAQFVEQFLNAAAIERPLDLVAHDFGGPFAFAWAVKHPAACAAWSRSPPCSSVTIAGTFGRTSGARLFLASSRC